MTDFSDKIINWHIEHGRKDMPWQNTKDPYAVWVSEIMLQQTQVTTVIPYYERFMQRFPSVQALAEAPIDEVLHMWTGLGYYARARNLHHAAQQVMTNHDGVFPNRFDDVVELKGIGRSTGGAILSFAFGDPHPILDGNVKRVLSRVFGVDGWTGDKKVSDQLWLIAEQHTPDKQIEIYTQAIMDFGATLCSRSKPLCTLCPVNDACVAYKDNRVHELPGKKPKKSIPVKQCVMAVVRNQAGHILLEQRPPSGIWGGLWSLPQFENEKQLTEQLQQQYGFVVDDAKMGTPFRHTFSHYRLDIQPIFANCTHHETIVSENTVKWVNLQKPLQIGLPAPIKKLLESI